MIGSTMTDHQCPNCGVAFMERANSTDVDAWCGAWFDHPPVGLGGCMQRSSSYLIESDALKRQSRELAEEDARRLAVAA